MGMWFDMFCWRNKKHGRLDRENGRGGFVLQEVIKSCDGNSNPIKSFCASQILKATDNFNCEVRVLPDSSKFYRGTLDDRLVLIKIWSSWEWDVSRRNGICRDIAMSSMVSGHKNFLKLLGCCLEFTCPVLVYEYFDGIFCEFPSYRLNPTLSWNTRIKIAKEIAYAVTYLHTAFSRTIIHRFIHPSNVSLDSNGTAKLSNLSYSVSIPQGETFVQVDRRAKSGIYLYMGPKYLRTGLVKENTDVYSFGVFMQVLLIGREPSWIGKLNSLTKLVEDGRFHETIDRSMLEKMGEAAEQERRRMESFLILSLRCTGHRGEVPKMIEVAKELERIERSADASPDIGEEGSSSVHSLKQI